VINTTRLLRRCAKYLENNSGGRKQTGETAFGLASTGDAQILRRIRKGVNVGDNLLNKIDKFLSEAGY
jgi:hypothetical protein